MTPHTMLPHEHLTAPLAIASVTALTSLIGQLGHNTTITVGEALTVFVFVATLVGWLSRKLQKIEDNVERAAEDIEELKKHAATRPCQNGSCSVQPKS